MCMTLLAFSERSRVRTCTPSREWDPSWKPDDVIGC